MFSLFNVFYGQSINQHHHLGITQGNASRPGIIGGDFKGAFFQTFIVQRKADPLPVQQLDLVAAPVDEDKYISIEGVIAKRVLHNPR